MVRETWRDPLGNYDNLIQERNDAAKFKKSKGHVLIHGWTITALSINSINVFVYSLVPLIMFMTQLKVTLLSRINCLLY